MKGVRKARTTTRLECGCWIRPGQPEVRTPTGWICEPCALARQGLSVTADMPVLAEQGQDDGP